MAELNQEVIENLKKSREIIGEIDEVLIDQNQNIIDGAHRLKAYPGWKTKVVQADYKQRILLRLHRNFRRTVSREETKKLLNELAQILKNEGTPEEQIAQKIVQLSPYSEPYTLSLLPKKYKQPKAVKAAKATYKVLYKEEKAKKEKAEPKLPKKYTCPVCGALLALVGELLIPYDQALKK
jgi:DNA-directed RNA polymerase subunit F